MKNSIVILFLLLLSQFGYAQGRTFKVTARPWVKGQKNLPWKEYDTRTIAQLDGFKPTGKGCAVATREKTTASGYRIFQGRTYWKSMVDD